MEREPYLEECPAYVRLMTGPEVPAPREVMVELTSCCNLSCLMCPRAAGRPRTTPGRVMETEVLERVIQDVLDELPRVNVVGDGEALLEPEMLLRLLSEAARRGVSTTLCTNGTLLDRALSRRLVAAGLSDLSISLDAACEETYRAIRGASLEELLRRLDVLRQERSRAGRDVPRLHATLVAMRRNIEELPDLVVLAARRGFESVTVQAMGEEGGDMCGESAFQNDPRATAQVLAAALDRADGCGIKLEILPRVYRPEGLRGSMPYEDGEPMFKDCGFPWTAPFVTATGEVRACCAEIPAMGHLLEAPLLEIWRGSRFQELRRALLARETPEVCLRCPGTGWRRGTRLRSSLSAEDLDHGFAAGYHDPEPGPPPLRWTDRRAVAFLDARGAETVLLEHRAGAMEGLPREGALLVHTEGQSQREQREPVPSSSEGWRITELTGGPWAGPVIRVDLEVPAARRPVELDPSSRDGRCLGLMVRRIQARTWSQRAVFDGRIALLDVDLPDTIDSGTSCEVRLYLRCLAAMHEEYRLLVHCLPAIAGEGLLGRLRSGHRSIAFQADHSPVEGRQPTTVWRPGQIYVDRFALRPPAGLRGEFEVRVGFYRPRGHQRLPVKDASAPHGRGWVTVGRVQVLHPAVGDDP